MLPLQKNLVSFSHLQYLMVHFGLWTFLDLGIFFLPKLSEDIFQTCFFIWANHGCFSKIRQISDLTFSQKIRRIGRCLASSIAVDVSMEIGPERSVLTKCVDLWPSGSMGVVYSPTFGWFFVVNVGIYTSPMDPIGEGFPAWRPKTKTLKMWSL